MDLISYAQNLEDIVLWRALGHVGHGRYIDIGAAWPDHDSVTRLFSERGWRGLNAEPNPELLAQLIERRPDDINLGCAVGAETGSITINVVAETGLSTAVDSVGDRIRLQGHAVERIEVPMRTLTDLWDEHLGDREVHFLKIDVEGFELAVLQGWQPERHRPWVLVVEATEPGTQREVHEQWEPLVVDSGYHLVYIDGINRFYVADEHPEVDASFRYPPNVFDSFRIAATVEAEQRAAGLEVALKEADHRAAIEAHELDLANERVAWLSADMAALTSRADEIHQRLQSVEARRAELDEQVVELMHGSEVMAARADGLDRALSARTAEASLAHQRAADLDAHIRAMYASTSWTFARPVRLARRIAATSVRAVLRPVVRFVAPRPLLRGSASRALRLSPTLHHALSRRVAAWSAPQTPVAPAVSPTTDPVAAADPATATEPTPSIDVQTTVPTRWDESATTLDVLRLLGPGTPPTESRE